MNDPVDDIARLCPICGEPMEVEERDRLEIDVCEEHGLWLDRGEYDVLRRRVTSGIRTSRQGAAVDAARERGVSAGYSGGTVRRSLFGSRRRRRARNRLRKSLRKEAEIQDNSATTPEGERRCCVCDDPMDALEKEDLWGSGATIILDVCDDHGIWLDNGELEALLGRARRDKNNFARSKRAQAFNQGFEDGRRRRRRANRGDWIV